MKTLIGILILCVACADSCVHAAELIELRDIPSGYDRVIPYGLSDDGGVVIGRMCDFEAGVGTTRGEAFR